MMISSEHRNCKPYAVPVQCIPYAGLNEDNLRRLITELVKEMADNGMKVAGRLCPGKQICIHVILLVIIVTSFDPT